MAINVKVNVRLSTPCGYKHLTAVEAIVLIHGIQPGG